LLSFSEGRPTKWTYLTDPSGIRKPMLKIEGSPLLGNALKQLLYGFPIFGMSSL
jgi:hypothetical protein